MRNTLRAEWAKTWSDPSTVWLLAGLVVATVGVSLATIAAASGQDPAKLSLTGIYLGQVIAAVTGVLAIGGEYTTGMITVSLTAVPRRLELLAAKALVLAGPVAAASATAVGGCLLAGWLILPGHWFGAADWRAAFCSVVYLTLIAVLSLGVTAVVRDSAVAAGVVLGLLFLFPVLITAVSDHTLVRRLEQISPLLAGQDLQATTGLRALPLSPWPALGVVTLWAAAALTAGGLALCRRDA